MKITQALIGVLVVASIGIHAAQTFRVVAMQRDLAQERQARADDRVVAERAALAAVEAVRDEETRRSAAMRKVADEAETKSAAARADAAAAGATAAKLRGHVRALATHDCPAGADPAASEPSEAAGQAARVLADMLLSMEAHGRVVVATADRAIGAGLACEQAFDALTAP